MSEQTYYDLLGVANSATTDEIKLAWRKVAKATHPDRYPDDSSKHKRFIQAKEAYDVLSDYDRRRFYDYELLARRAIVCPSCGKPKMPTHRMCVWCALARVKTPPRPEEAHAKEPPPPPDDNEPYVDEPPHPDPAHDERDSGSPWPFRGINPDDLLDQVLSQGAFRAARGLHPDIRFGVHIGPNLKVDIEGETVELLRDVHRNLSAAQRLAQRIRRWFVT